MATAMDTSPPQVRGGSGGVVARRRLCEYGLMPVQSLLPRMDHPPAVLSIARRLRERAQLDASGTQYFTRMKDVASILGICESTTMLIVDKVEAVSPEGAVIRDEAGQQPVAISVPAIALFLFVQLHSRQGTLANVAEVWPALRDLECNEGPLSPTRSSATPSSPRSARGKKGKHQQNRKWFQEQLQHHQHHLDAYPGFVRRHIRHLLLLVVNNPPEAFDAPSIGDISIEEFNRLGMVLQPVDHAKSLQPLGNLVPGLSTEGRASLQSVEQWLQANTADKASEAESLGGVEGPRIGYSSGTVTQRGAGLVDMQGIVKATVVRGDDLCPGGELRISDCHDVVIYALTPLQTASVFGCSDATIVIGAVGQVVRLERCERLQLIVASKHVTISTCHDCTLFLATNRPPCLIGDNRFIQLAPYCTQYDELVSHLEAAGVSRNINLWDKPITVARDARTHAHAPDSPRGPGSTRPGAENRMTSQWSLLPPHKLLPFVVPFKGSGGSLGGGGVNNPLTPTAGSAASLPVNPFQLPPQYESALGQKVHGVAELRAAVKSAVLEEPRKRELQAVIQAHFKEWLVASGNMRQIYDLARLEREEG